MTFCLFFSALRHFSEGNSKLQTAGAPPKNTQMILRARLCGLITRRQASQHLYAKHLTARCTKFLCQELLISFSAGPCKALLVYRCNDFPPCNRWASGPVNMTSPSGLMVNAWLSPRDTETQGKHWLCMPAGNRKHEYIFGRARRDQPHSYSRRSLRHCPYCRPVKAHIESQCPTRATCSASLSSRHQDFLPLQEFSICASLLLCMLSGKATPARGHTRSRK